MLSIEVSEHRTALLLLFFCSFHCKVSAVSQTIFGPYFLFSLFHTIKLPVFAAEVFPLWKIENQAFFLVDSCHLIVFISFLAINKWKYNNCAEHCEPKVCLLLCAVCWERRMRRESEKEREGEGGG